MVIRSIMINIDERFIVLAESDEHSGHKLGLCNPNTLLLSDKKEVYGPSLVGFQQYLWDLRTKDLAWVEVLAAGDPIVYIHGGDITHGTRFPTQLMESRMSDQPTIAYHNAIPVYELHNVIAGRIIIGTGLHVFGEGSSEILVAEMLRAKYPKIDTWPIAHSRITIGGIIFDVAHHGPGAGIRVWTRGNVAMNYLKSKMWQDFKNGKKPAHVYLRGHYHTFVFVTNRERFDGVWYESHLIIMPSWCGMTEHARKATQSDYEVINGLVAFEIMNNEVKVHPRDTPLDLRTEEIIGRATKIGIQGRDRGDNQAAATERE